MQQLRGLLSMKDDMLFTVQKRFIVTWRRVKDVRLTGDNRTVDPPLKIHPPWGGGTLRHLLRTRDSSSWSSLVTLRDIHANLFPQYDWKEVCPPIQSQPNIGTRTCLSSQDGVSQQEESSPLSLPQLNHLFEDSFERDETFRDLKLKSVGHVVLNN